MSERRLINKKAYEELKLLTEFCEREENEEYQLKPYLDLCVENFKERFSILIFEKENLEILEVLSGKNYAEITKLLMARLNE